MPGDDRKISKLACVLLVSLRLFIGWHLLYEGYWKIQSQSTAQPWSAEGYLRTAIGPMRPTFRTLAGDPDDFHWLDYPGMEKRWADWKERFLKHYPGTREGNPSVEAVLTRMLEGPGNFTAPLAALPEGINFAEIPEDLIKEWKVNPKELAKAIKFDAGKKLLIVDGKFHLLPNERDLLLALAPVEGDLADDVRGAREAYRKAVEEVYKRASKLSFHERLKVLLEVDPDRVGVLLKEKDGKEIQDRVGEITFYKELVGRYEAGMAKASQKYQWDHLDRQWTELQQKRQQVVGPVKALDAELREAAEKLLTLDQLRAGPVPEPPNPISEINWRTMWGLTIIGILLLIGLATRVAALGGAALLSLFYMAVPPWPGVPEIPGPEHNFIVNKVFVEMAALLAIAALPTGRWFGVDALWGVFFRRKAR